MLCFDGAAHTGRDACSDVRHYDCSALANRLACELNALRSS